METILLITFGLLCIGYGYNIKAFMVLGYISLFVFFNNIFYKIKKTYEKNRITKNRTKKR